VKKISAQKTEKEVFFFFFGEEKSLHKTKAALGL
jgi:hypothetical protein